MTDIGDDGSLVVAEAGRGSVRLPAAYVARRVELGWAVTGYGTQGVTTDHGIAVVEPSSTRAGIYVAMTRGRGRNAAWIVDRTRLADAEEILAAAIARPANALSAPRWPPAWAGKCRQRQSRRPRPADGPAGSINWRSRADRPAVCLVDEKSDAGREIGRVPAA